MKIVAKTSPLESVVEEGPARPLLRVLNTDSKVEAAPESATENSNDEHSETRRGLERLLNFVKREAQKPKLLAPERQLFFDKQKSIQKYITQVKSQDQDNQKGMAFDIAA